MEEARDWRAGSAPTTFDYLRSGSPTRADLGGVVSGTFDYYQDGSLSDLKWLRNGSSVREHHDLRYDEGKMRLSEDVSVARTLESAGADTGGPASYSYDLAGRLESWTSSYGSVDPATQQTVGESHSSDYTLDDAGNIATETTSGQGSTQRIASTYEHGRLKSRDITCVPTCGSAHESFTYNELGEETNRELKIEGVTQSTTATTYDAAGRVNKATTTGLDAANVEYGYDANGQLSWRKSAGETKLFFYWGLTSSIAEEVEVLPTGPKTATLYFMSSSGQALAKQTYELGLAQEWDWLLRDVDGNIASEVKDEASVPGDSGIKAQKAYDPYGAPDVGGTEENPLPGQSETELGFQGSNTDEATDKVLLGPRQYDPETQRFSSADTFVAGGVDMALGTDPLTGNRYLFAAANPVAFYENGYVPGGDPSASDPSGSGGSGGGGGGSGGGDDSRGTPRSIPPTTGPSRVDHLRQLWRYVYPNRPFPGMTANGPAHIEMTNIYASLHLDSTWTDAIPYKGGYFVMSTFASLDSINLHQKEAYDTVTSFQVQLHTSSGKTLDMNSVLTPEKRDALPDRYEPSGGHPGSTTRHVMVPPGHGVPTSVEFTFSAFPDYDEGTAPGLSAFLSKSESKSYPLTGYWLQR